MTGALGVGPLRPDQIAVLRRSLAKEGGSDLSPSERYSVKVSRDSVVLTETATGVERKVRVQGPRGIHPLAATVSDKGDLAILAEPRDHAGYLVGRVQPDGTFQQVAREGSAMRPELSADGSRLTWLSDGAIREEAGGGVHTLASTSDRFCGSEFLDDGRLLVKAERSFNSCEGVSVPHYWLVDPSGGLALLEDLDTVEQLGVPVRRSLGEVYHSLFPDAPKDQQKELVEFFGYRVPGPPARSPSKDRFLVWASRGADGGGFGLYRLESGKGAPKVALSSAEAGAQGRTAIVGAAWQRGERRAAVALQGAQDRLALVDFRGTSWVFPGELSKAAGGPSVEWSFDGRWLAAEMKTGRGPVVHLYDPEADLFYPAAPVGRFLGWHNGCLKVKVDGCIQEIPAGPPDPAMAGDYLTGSSGQEGEPGETIREGDGEVQVGDVRLPPKPAGP